MAKKHQGKLALEITRDITVAKLRSSSEAANGVTGENAAKFFENVYDKVSELVSEISDSE